LRPRFFSVSGRALPDAGRVSLSVGSDAFISQWPYVLLGVASFSIKVLVFCWLFMQLRWTLPRFRYDQLMRLGWLGLFPISVSNVLVTASVLTFFSD
jgi:NADH-quinone oxidoreductase subunit H